MSALSSITNFFRNFLENMAAYCRLSKMYLKRHNPIKIFIANVQKGFSELMNAKKKMLIARYRVNHLRYRVNQMEKLINDNNPYNIKGSSINQIR